MCFLASILISNSAIAQDIEVIEDFEGFEHIPINEMANGWIEQDDDEESFEVVENPDRGDANDSEYVLQFNRAYDGDPWAGFWSDLPDGVDLTERKYVHVQLWKPRESPVQFKVEGGDETDDIEIESIEPHTETEEWVTLSFDFEEHDATGEYSVISLMPDFEDPVDLEDDLVIYIDNIVLSDSPEDPFPLEDDDAEQRITIEDFEDDEYIELNVQANGSLDSEEDAFEVIDNPAPDDVNDSEKVLQFNRAADGDPWAGFWSELPEVIDMTDFGYIEVDVWKPRESPVHFKVEGGETDDIEIEPIEPQTKTEEWETLVFDFAEEGATGEYPIIALMPDFEDPLELDEDITIYIDNIRLSNTSDKATSIDDPTEEPDIASNIELEQNYPNPFNPVTQIQYSISEHSNVTLEVYDVLGRHVSTLVDETQSPGQYEISFDGSDLSSGTYIYRLQAGDQTQSRTMMLVK